MDNKIRFEKHIFGDLAISSQDLIGIFGPGKIEGEGLSDSEIHQRICKPLGTEPLSRLVKNKRKILIVTDDNTRNTPLKRILPVVLAELHAAGVHNENITILIGLGTHRPMTQSEILEKFGEKISGQYNIVNHAWDDPSSLFRWIQLIWDLKW